MKSILFLDIDGVLNSVQYAIRTKGKVLRRGWEQLDPNAVKYLQRIVDATNCDIVIMSTWRRIYTLDEIAAMLVEADMRAPVPIIGRTPVNRCGLGLVRGNEVQDWILDRSFVDRYVCVDDDTDFLPYQPLVRTNNEVGLTSEDADRCIMLLTASP